MKLSTSEMVKHFSAQNTVELSDKSLHDLQHCLLEIMDDIGIICEENKINYSLVGGCAIGAVRHGGMIPWDDDIDIVMTRLDHERFIHLPHAKLKEYWIHTPSCTAEYGLSITKILKKGTIYRDYVSYGEKECGVFVDIFILENTFNNPIGRTLHGVLCMFMGLCLSCRRFFRDRKYLMELAEDNPQAKKTFRLKILIGFFTAILPMDTWTRLTDKCYSLCKNNRSKYVTVPSGVKHYFGEMLPREVFAETELVPFDGHQYRLIKRVDEYLTKRYGDYMRVPPPEEREKHMLLEFDLGEYTE